jgi:uncharacterized membrane protein HdeD (DUF308 family)
MEAALLTEDPRLVSALSATPVSPSRNRIMTGAGLMILGLATLFGGLIAQITPIGILGFIIALSGVITAISSISPQVRGPKKPRTRTNLSARLEQRWENRSNEE